MPASLRPDIAIDARARLGEGPVWDEQQQRLLWLDILPGLVHRYDPATGGDDVLRVGKPTGSAGLRRGGGLVLAVEDGFALLDPDWQRLDQIAVIEHPGPRARFNEGKCDPAGRFLAGTMAYDETAGAGSVYRLDPDLAVTKLLDGVTISNGLAWTADGATMYYIDSPTQGVDAFDYDPGTGRLANRRRVVDIPEAAGLPDGMTLDADGCLWIALYGVVAGSPDQVHEFARRPSRRHAVLSGHEHHLPGLRRPGARRALRDQRPRRPRRAAAGGPAARGGGVRGRRGCPRPAGAEVRWLMPR